MRRFLLAVVAAASCFLVLPGCDSGGGGFLNLGGWGELGDEVSTGPYKFRPPKRFTMERAPGASGETRIMYRGPVSGKSEPGILINYAPHRMDLSSQSPNWSEGMRLGTRALKLRCEPNTFTSQAGAMETYNGLPGARIQFSGVLRHASEKRKMHGIGYILADDTNLVFVIGMDFGPDGAENVAKLEKSLKTLHRPGFEAPSYFWMNGGQSPPGGLAQRPGGPGSSAPRPPSAPQHRPPSYPGSSSGAVGSPPGSSYPGSGAPPGSRPGAPASSKSPEELKRLREEAEDRANRMAAAESPDDPGYFKANLEILRGGQDLDKRKALTRMTEADPNDVDDNELRKDIAKAIRDASFDQKATVWTRQQAISGLVVWGSTYSVPLLIDLLKDDQRLVKEEALKALSKLKDERAIEPVTRLFAKDMSLRRDAGECLRAFGSSAEATVLELVEAKDFIITRETVKLLGDIGTTKSVTPLRSLRKLSFYRLVEGDVSEALDKIRARRSSGD